MLSVFIFILAPGMGHAGVPATTSTKPTQRVLVLYSDDRLLPANITIDEAIRATFAASTSNRVEYYSEFLDSARFPGEAQQQSQRDFLRDRYRERPPDLVITVSGAALNFVMKYRAELFAGVPIVHCTVADEPLPRDLEEEKIATVPVHSTVASTLELALSLQPDTRMVAVVSGSSPRDAQLTDGPRSEIRAFEKRVTITWLANRSLPELRDELSRLPKHAIVLYLTMFQDASGRKFNPREALEQFAPASSAPVYGYYDSYLGYGIVGGSMVTFEEIGQKAAQLAVRILAGEDGQIAARSESNQAVPIFDWRQLRRWNISEYRLPSGSVIRFRPPTLWQQHKDYVIGGISVIVAQTATIVMLLVQRSRRRLAEATTREDEKRMALAADAVKLGLWMWDIPSNHLWVSERGKQLFGYPPDAKLTLEMLGAQVHPEDRAMREETIQRALAGTGDYDPEYRVQLPDGTVRWLAARGHVEFNSAGKPLLMRGVSVDITERKQAELEFAEQRNEVAHLSRISTVNELSGSLAHELNQPLAIILSNAQAAQRFLAQQPPDLAEVQDILADIVSEDQRAGEVIKRLRAILKPGETHLQFLTVNNVIEEVLQLVRSDLTGHGIMVHRNLEASLPTVRGDPIQLQQVFLNLILNACDAMGESPPARRHLTLATAHRDGVVRVSVSDTGCGLPPDVERIFKPFYTTKRHGLGLGLAICRSIVSAHKGRLWAEANVVPGGPSPGAEASCGATLHLELPVEQGEIHERDQRPGFPPGRRTGDAQGADPAA